MTAKTTRPADQPFRYPDGLGVQLRGIHPSTVAPYASGAYPGEPIIVMTLQLANHTKTSVDTGVLQLTARYDDAHLDQPGAAEIGEVTDQQTSDMPNPIPRDQTGSSVHEFLVPTRCVSKVIVQVTPDTDHRPVRFAITKH